MNTRLSVLLAAAFGVSTMMVASAPAQATVVCNADGDCWHTHTTYTYPPAAGVVIHDDAWKWEGDRYHWREHEGRGYWHGGAWVDF